jgi:hypothetical protein
MENEYDDAARAVKRAHSPVTAASRAARREHRFERVVTEHLVELVTKAFAERFADVEDVLGDALLAAEDDRYDAKPAFAAVRAVARRRTVGRAREQS